MRMSFHRIAYEALDVCNAVQMTTIEAALSRRGRPSGRALDIGCGNGAVAIRLAEAFNMTVTAVEMDPAMADLARTRAAGSGARDRVAVIEAQSADVLNRGAPWDLIVAMGATEPVGDGLREPAAVLAALAERLRPGGGLLWGDLVWLAEPSAPLRQIIELSGLYADHDGWRAAARAAGLEVVSADLSDPALWDAYSNAMMDAVRDWLAANPDHADAPAIRLRADQIATMLEFGRWVLGFGLYMLRRP